MAKGTIVLIYILGGPLLYIKSIECEALPIWTDPPPQEGTWVNPCSLSESLLLYIRVSIRCGALYWLVLYQLDTN